MIVFSKHFKLIDRVTKFIIKIASFKKTKYYTVPKYENQNK